MAAQEAAGSFDALEGQFAVWIKNLCKDLTESGKQHVHDMAARLENAAPRPGSLVYLDTRDLSILLNGFEAVLFSAIDACTFLQVGQIYLTATTAAAISFYDFVVENFPFAINQVRTLNRAPFCQPPGDRSYLRFTETVERRGRTHTMITVASQDPLYCISSRLTFGAFAGGSTFSQSESEMQRDLIRFVFFHNNCRSIPWLGGRTPLQKLTSFQEFAGRRSFDPYGGPGEHCAHKVTSFALRPWR